MVYITIQVATLHGAKGSVKRESCLICMVFHYNCILGTQSSKDTLHRHGLQVLNLAGYTNSEVDYLVFRGTNVMFFNVCKCNAIVDIMADY